MKKYYNLVMLEMRRCKLLCPSYVNYSLNTTTVLYINAIQILCISKLSIDKILFCKTDFWERIMHYRMEFFSWSILIRLHLLSVIWFWITKHLEILSMENKDSFTRADKNKLNEWTKVLFLEAFIQSFILASIKQSHSFGLKFQEIGTMGLTTSS